MRLRSFIFALALCLPLSSATAAPSPSPTVAKSPPAAPLKPTGPVKPLQKASPTPPATPVATAPPRRRKSSTPPSPDSSPSPSPSPSPKSSPSPTAALKPDAELDLVAEEYIRGYLAARPLEATALGFHEYDGRINEFTRLSIDAELARLTRFDDRLKKFELAKLGPRPGIDLRLLQAAIRKELFLMQELAMYEKNPMSYARALDVGVFIKRKYAPIEDRVRSIVVVENQAPNVIIAAKTNLAEVLPKPYVELAIQIARGASEFLKKDLIEGLADLKDENLRNTFLQSNRRAATALADYAAWLEKEKLPKATPEFAIGEEKYRRFLAETELVDLPPAQLLELGLAELKKEQDVFAEAAGKIDETRPAPVVFKQIQGDHPTAENLIPEITKRLDAIRKFVVDRNLVAIPPKVPAPQVKEMPPDRRATSFAWMDVPGPFEKRANEAYFYVTPPEKDWPEEQKEAWLTSFNFYMGDLFSIHEAYPGHYVQHLHLNASKASKAQKIFGATSYIEGWAHYCEKMMIDEGFGAPTSPEPQVDEIHRAAKYRMVQAQAAMVRLCRLIVSIRMHTQGMSVEEAAKFFQENCYYEEKPAQSEAMRGTYDIGSLNYTLGKLQILKLRNDYQAQEGDKFSLKKFHDEVLGHGMLPIRLLREVMLKDKEKWGEVL